MSPERREISQAQFAKEMGVSRAAVTHWKKDDILREDAFTKPGKTGKLIFQIAVEQVRQNRDIGQSLGNGIKTNVGLTPLPAASAASTGDKGIGDAQPEIGDGAVPNMDATPEKSPSIQDQLAAAKLEEQKRRNRRQASDEALRKGLLMSSDDVREQMASVATIMLQIFEGSLADFASALAEKFSIPQRDALHLLRSEFVKVRKSAAKKEAARADRAEKDIVARVGIDA